MVLLFLVAMYGVAPETLPFLRPFRPAMVLAVGALGLLVLERTLSGRPFILSWPESHALLGFFGAAALSVFTAFWPGMSTLVTIELGKLIIVYLLIVNVVTTRKRLRGLIWTVTLAGLFPAVGTIRNYLDGNVVDGRAAWLGKFAGPNELAFELAILVPLALALMVMMRWRGKLLLAGVAAVDLVAIFYTYSRSGLIGFAAMVPIAIARVRSHATRMAIIVSIVIAGFLATQYWERDQGFEDVEEDSTFNQRIVSIQTGLAMFQSSPITGIGFGCSGIGWEEFSPDTSVTHSSILIVHNTFVQVLAETGVLGFVLFYIAVFGAAISMYRVSVETGDSDPELCAYATATGLGILAFLVSGLANGFVGIAAPYLLLAIASAVKDLAASGTPAEETEEPA